MVVIHFTAGCSESLQIPGYSHRGVFVNLRRSKSGGCRITEGLQSDSCAKHFLLDEDNGLKNQILLFFVLDIAISGGLGFCQKTFAYL